LADRESSFEDYKKVELEAALDGHLRANTSVFSSDKRLAEYYRRLAQPPRIVSPVKLKTEFAGSGDEVKKPSRRRQTKAKDDVEARCVTLPPRASFSGVARPRGPK
jgi:hypothetical protein